MGDTKLFVLLLFYIAFTVAKRYKSFQKYEYLYEAESLNTLNGVINGPKVSCKVEIEVPGTCHFIVQTKECILSEVVGVEDDGNPIFETTAGAENFKAEMEKNPLKVIVEGDNDIKLFPEDDELINILNIKRGIISALAVPVLKEEKNKKMPTIYGLCTTDYTVNTREDIATDVTLNRDLSRCDQFKPIMDHTSPLALITGMNYPLAQLIRSKQTCSYKFDNKLRHMTSGVCNEDHLFVPFSHTEKDGLIIVAKQTLSMLEVTEYNERVFDHNEANMKTLYLDESVDMSPSQDENAILAVLRELSGLSQTTNGQQRAHLAYKLVAVIRKLNADTLSAALPKALEISPSLTYQALFQCGTPECSSALMQVLRTFKSPSEIDAAVYAMGLVPNPSRVLVKEMLKMAKFKPSKLIYYATSNAVRRLYKAEKKVTPEIQAVAEYVLENIGDCTGDQEHIYLTLRVIGNMAEAVGAASPALMSAVIQCINQPVASSEVQQAAIQVFRLTPVPKESRTVLTQVLLDKVAPVKKRIAAYLILMKNPQPGELTQLTAALPSEEDLQVKSFVISHLTNILSSTAEETKELRQKVIDALQGNEVGDVMDATKFSRNYKIGSLEGNMVFDNENNLPTEVMLEMTLNAFGYDIDMVEIGLEGKGFEPTADVLFGPNGFFPDTVMKTFYYAIDKMPSQVNDILNNMIPGLNDRKKRQVPKNIIKEISKNVNKLMKNLKTQNAPEVMLYLRLLGAELGYLKTKDLEAMAYSVTKVAENLLKVFPSDCLKNLFSSIDNELFLHYIFMDNEFYLPTGPGLPLRVALSGTFTPGVKGGLIISPQMNEIAFMPSADVEFVTEIGAHLPDYVNSGLKMHTNIYHESGLRAKVTMARNQFKLTIPVPENPVKLLSVSNSIVSVIGDKTNSIPAMKDNVEMNECAPLLPGVNFCGVVQYSEDPKNVPFYGFSKFALELQPTVDVSEYTATISYAHEENTEKVTFDVKAEGTTFGATSKIMFNRQEYTASAELQIPDYDIMAGINIAADPNTKDKGTHSIQIDFINKKIPQATLIGLANYKAMEDALLQVQLLVPSLEANAKVTANLKYAEELILESYLKFLDISSVQKLILKYDNDKVEAKIISDVSSKTENIVSNFNNKMENIGSFLDQNIGQSEKISNALTSLIKTTNSYIEASEIPYIEYLWIPNLIDFELPEMLFLNIEAGAKYHFGKHYYTITLPMPLGGKSSKDLSLPPAVTIPNLAIPQLGLKIASIKVPLPEVLIPKTLTLSLPTIGKAEVSGKLSSNLYDLEATVSAGRDSDEHQSYSARFGVTGSGPVELMSVRTEGSALITGIMTDTLKAEMETSVHHKLIDASINIAEEIQIMEKIRVKSSSKLEATSPFSVKFSLEHTSQVAVNTEEISGESNLKGSFLTGSNDGDVTLTQSLALFPFKPEARIDSTLKINATPFQAQNKIEASFVDGELSVVSTSAAFEDMLTHNAAVTLMSSRCILKSDTKALALGMEVHNIAEANIGLEDISIKIETTTSHSEDQINSMIFATLSGNGLVANSYASIKLDEHSATHKANVTLNRNGLVTSGTTSVNSLLTLENTFNSILDSSQFSLSTKTNGKLLGVAMDNTNSISAEMFSVKLTSKSRVDVAQDIWYIYDISAKAEPYTATASVTNNLKLASATELKNTCEFKLAGLTGNVKCSTNGNIIGAFMSHDTEMEIIGVGVRINNGARFNSEFARFTTTLQATASPLSINVNALANGDGELYLYGKHSAQVYTKFLLKAEPLAFAHAHECRISTTHELNNNVIFEANIDKKVDTQLSPSEQSATVTITSKINNNLSKQELKAYNKNEKIGLEMLGEVTFRESQDFSISALVQYDKNSESHIINLPLLSAVLENLKNTFVSLAETLQDYIKRNEFVVQINTLRQHISEFLIDFKLEEKFDQLKTSLVTFVQDCQFTTEELEAAVTQLKTVTLNVLAEFSSRANEVQELILSGALSDTVVQKLNSLNEEYDIRSMLLAVIEAIENVIKQTDITKLEESSIPVFYDVEKLKEIKLHLQEYVADLKNVVTNFDKAQFVEQIQNIITTTEMYTNHLLAKLPKEEIGKIANTLKQLITELDITGSCKALYSSFKDVSTKYELDKKIKVFLDKLHELMKQLNVEETIEVLGSAMKVIPEIFTDILGDVLRELKRTDIKTIIKEFNELIENIVQSVKSFEYNTFVDDFNWLLNEFIVIFNDVLPSKLQLEELKKSIEDVMSFTSPFLEELQSAKVKEVKDLIDTYVLNNIKTIAQKFKQDIVDMDIRGELQLALQQLRDIYNQVMAILTNAFNDTKVLGDQEFFTELKQITVNVVEALRTSEIEIPSFTVPLTDLILPSWKFSLHELQEAELPEEINIPQFTILGSYNVPAVMITYNDFKQILIELADFIINFNIELFDHFYIEKLYPDLSTITLPEITLPSISLPTLPKLSDKYILDLPLQIPEIKLPKIPDTLVLPAFGKLHGMIKVNSPIYNIRTIVEVKNSTDSEHMHHFIALINSVGESSSFNILTYNLDATMRIGLPKMSRVIIADTLKFKHSALTVEHQAAATLYGLSAQATAQTTVKVTTKPYSADIFNKAFFALGGGMSTSFETNYRHSVNFPALSLASDVTLNHSALISQKDGTIRVTVGNTGTDRLSYYSYSAAGTHKSDLSCTISPTSIKMTLTGDTDSPILKSKGSLNVEGVALSYIDFNGRIETQSLFIKNNVIVASGMAHLEEMKIELKATHDTELWGDVSGTFSNAVNFKAHPVEIIVDIQNKGNGEVSSKKFLSTKFDFQNNYALTLNPMNQLINTAALVRFSQNKYSYNFRIVNNNVETAVYAAANGEIDLDFLTVPISIPEIDIPVIDVTIPAINDVNLYETTVLKYLYTTKPTIDVNTKIVYKKSKFVPIIDLGFISVPAVGNLISEMSFKSSIFNLIANAGIYGDNDLVIRVAATSNSVFEELKANLKGTSSLTMKRGLKLATALTLNNAYIEGTHNSTLTVNINNLEATLAVTSVANMKLPILSIEVNHNLLADTKTHPNVASTLTINHKFDLPIIMAVGSGEAKHIVKVDAAASYISAESTTKAMIDGTFLETGIMKGALDSEATMHMTGEILRSRMKTIGNVNVNRGNLKVVFDIDEKFDMDLKLGHVYTIMTINSNNEVNIATFNTKGKHAAKATFDLAPTRSFIADVEFDLSQPTSLGDLTIYDKTAVDLSLLKQKISCDTKMVSPVYTSKIVFEVEGDIPIFKVVFKSSSQSPVVILQHELDSYLSTAMEKEVLKATAKATFEHDDFTIDFNSIFIPSEPSHTMNVDITSPTFTDVKIRYAAQKEEMTASVSSRSTGLLGFQLQSKIPSQLTSRLYGQYAIAAPLDIDILKINVAANEDDKIHFQVDCNLEAPKEMILVLKKRVPLMTSAITNFAKKYGIVRAINGLKSAFISALTEAYTISHNHAPDLSQLSVLFRNVVVQKQKAIQHLINAAVTFLRETQIRLPGMKQTTLREICQKIKSNIAVVLEEFISTIFNHLKAHFSTTKIDLWYGESITGDEILSNIENMLTDIVNMIKQLSHDVILEKLGQTLQEVVKEMQKYIDTIQSDFLDNTAASINTLYTKYITLINSLIKEANRSLNINSFNVIVDKCMELAVFMIEDFNHVVSIVFPIESEQPINFHNGRLKIDISLPFSQ
ncbi:apolipoprotein Bb, tandem duplicate 1 isoform X1 [Silurus asotus]|uniref:Apolipoprotein Bb, tandem duplicate 1 isoform X1 n=1 Tax=Silurus asotus TaxID=30991 RepID=A0AAD5A7Q4_SILAS|nr:apolipoprotein Bb, tandem duplicate 1 isoform X1 [Silurus asotus]